jgi:hypothetical protein
VNRRKFFIKLVSSAGLMLAGCHQYGFERETGGDEASLNVSEDELLVYAACLKDVLDPGAIALIVERTTNELEEPVSGVLQELDIKRETLDAFRLSDGEDRTIGSRLTTLARCHLISPEELQAIFSNGRGWDALKRRFPNSQGIFYFSRVGFSGDCKQALVYIQINSGPRSGIAYFQILEKDDNTVWHPTVGSIRAVF